MGKTIFGRYYLVAYSAPPKSNLLDDPLDSQITIVSKTAVFLRPRWLVVTFSSRNPFLPSYPLQIFLPGDRGSIIFVSKISVHAFRRMAFWFQPRPSQLDHLIFDTGKKSMMLDWFTYMTCFPVDFSVPSKKTKLRDYRWTMCYHL